MKKLPLTFLIILFTLTSNVVWSADYEKGETAYQDGDYATALSELKPLANQGYDRAQFRLGWMYDMGYGVPEDDKHAVKWYTLAAGQGDSKAQTNLGYMYANGLGTLQDLIRAHMWWIIAASQGQKEAIKGRDIVAKKMTPSQIERAQDLVRECVKNKYKAC